MVFSSIIFIFYFLPLFLLGYYLSGWRTGVLLLGSAVFYTWGEGAYVLLLLGMIALNYGGALLLNRGSGARRGLVFSGLVVLDFAVLGFFKYAGFLAQNLDALLPGLSLPQIHPTLPLGVSFFTFQLVSYLADVHRGTVQVERDPAKFAAYILMFPHLIAGPIVRYADIREEMHGDRRRSGHRGLGVQYFIVGLSQKVLVVARGWGGLLPISGWFAPPAFSQGSTRGWVRIQGEGGDFAAPLAIDGARPDVAAYLKTQRAGRSGFLSVFPGRDLPRGAYQVTLYRRGLTGLTACRAGGAIQLH